MKKTAAIICEFNPFHLGHKRLIDIARERGAENIVCIMSGNFVQRADTALTDKYRRAECAVLGGADLVIELPLPYAVAPAEDFGLGGISLLSATGVVDTVCCGSESGDEKNRRQYEALCRAEKLGKIKEKMQNKVALREGSGEMRVVVGMATCGIAAGARPVLNALVEEVNALGLADNVTVSQTGCIGICEYEPVVEVFEAGKEKVTYVQMTAEKAVKVVTEHIVNGKPVAEYTVGAVTE